ELIHRQQLGGKLSGRDRHTSLAQEDVQTQTIGLGQRRLLESERLVQKSSLDGQRFGDVRRRYVVAEPIVVALVADKRGLQRIELERAFEVILEHLGELNRSGCIRGARRLIGGRCKRNGGSQEHHGQELRSHASLP